MNFEAIKLWLTNQNKIRIRNRWLFAALGIVLLPFGTLVGGGIIYSIFWSLLRRSTGIDETALSTRCLWITLGILVCMFVVNLVISKKEEPEKFYHEDSGSDGSILGGYSHRRKIQLQFFLWLILTGPRLLSWSISSIKEAIQLKNQDTHSGAALLWILMSNMGKVTYEKIAQDLDWLDIDSTLSGLKGIEGIVLLKGPPAGISLSDDLRTAIRTGSAPP